MTVVFSNAIIRARLQLFLQGCSFKANLRSALPSWCASFELFKLCFCYVAGLEVLMRNSILVQWTTEKERMYQIGGSGFLVLIMVKICKAVLKEFLKAILSNKCPARDNYEKDIKKTDLIKINFYWTILSSMWCCRWCWFCLTGQIRVTDVMIRREVMIISSWVVVAASFAPDHFNVDTLQLERGCLWWCWWWYVHTLSMMMLTLSGFDVDTVYYWCCCWV